MPDEEVKVEKQTSTAQEQGPDLGLEREVPAEVKEEVREAEKKPEAKPEKIEPEKPQEAPEVSVPKAVPEEPTQAPIKKDEILVDLEGILADDLTEVFLELPDDKKLAFKKKGEEVAIRVYEMIHSGKVKVGKILGWIREWLRMIPRVNKFFIDQEAKIKADKILTYARDQQKRRQDKI